MGNKTKLVTIDNLTYIINDCPNDLVAVEEAIKIHRDKLEKEKEFYKNNNIRDINGAPIYVDYTINEIIISKYGI